MDWNAFYAGVGNPDWSRLNDTSNGQAASPDRPRDNQAYDVPMGAIVHGGVSHPSEIDFSAFYGDILPYYQANPTAQPSSNGPVIPYASGTVTVKDETRLQGGSFMPVASPIAQSVGDETRNFLMGLVEIAFPRPRPDRPNGTGGGEYVPNPGVAAMAPELNLAIPQGAAQTTRNAAPNTASPHAFSFNPTVTFALPENANPLLRLVEGFLGAMTVRPPVQIRGNTVGINVRDFAAFLNANPEFLPAEWEMPQFGNSPVHQFTQEEVAAANRAGLLNAESYAALADGRTSYSLEGTLIPTVATNGSVRNTYADKGGSLLDDGGEGGGYGVGGNPSWWRT